MKRFILGAAVLSLFAADVAAAQTTVRENRHGDTVVTRQNRNGTTTKRVYQDGSRQDRRYERATGGRQFTYGGRRYNQVRGSRWIAPRGWTYRRYSIGASLPLFFLAATYYVDPFAYGINYVPRARYGQRWIRVGNDLYLVNRNGRIVQVVPDVFYY